ncbi:MAG: UDP-N-acetylmuramate dehydrogenase, partial [Actinomycetota bacterium]|nr:UDP-N-acetylmuramate dehydrogenase [Actinomycetota bacterium]
MTAVPPTADDRGAVDAAAAVLGDRARRDVPLGPLTTYRVGGPAALLVRAENEDDLALVGEAVTQSGIEVLVVGRGSNLLVADAGFPGLVLTLGDNFATIEVDGTLVRAGAAVSLPVLARRTAAAGLTGLEWAVGVPGSVGGGVRMNAGGHGSEIRGTLRRARLVDLARSRRQPPAAAKDGAIAGRAAGAGRGPVDVEAAELGLGYRRSTVAAGQVVVAAEFELETGDRATSEAELAAITRWRRENQPGGANAGSVFTNPPGDSAGRLIDAAGCKGRRRGSAFVSPKHANFFQVDNGG